MEKTDFVLKFGKFKGEPVSALVRSGERKYLLFIAENCKWLKKWQRDIIYTLCK
jgi:spore cortex formation protein SpoVR/YcgB (stage V sporulation)